MGFYSLCEESFPHHTKLFRRRTLFAFAHKNRPANLAAAVVQSSAPPASLQNAPGRETGSVLPRGPSYFLLFYVTPALKITSLVLCTTLIPWQKNSTPAIPFLPPTNLPSNASPSPSPPRATR